MLSKHLQKNTFKWNEKINVVSAGQNFVPHSFTAAVIYEMKICGGPECRSTDGHKANKLNCKIEEKEKRMTNCV